jgi:hypothetical protein
MLSRREAMYLLRLHGALAKNTGLRANNYLVHIEYRIPAGDSEVRELSITIQADGFM